MEPDVIWELFEKTGAPAFYLLYRQALKAQEEQEQMPVSA